MELSLNTPTDIDVLSESECGEVRNTIHELRQHWISRAGPLPFFTLGVASYLDAKSDFESYASPAARLNPVLQENFGWLYERLTGVLSKTLDAEVQYHQSAALPGFHIFLAHKAFESSPASIHRDLQYRSIRWDDEDHADFENPLSFTLTITLPSGGAGLSVWDLEHHEMKNYSQEEIVELIQTRPRQYHPYKLGHMAVHSGHMVHQIAPARNIQPGDERITLQGHGICQAGTWQLYW